LNNSLNLKKPGTYIYSTKIINQVSQKFVLDTFYEVLGNEKFDFSTSDPEILISTIGEILYSNPNSNINLDEINLNNFDENDLDAAFDKHSKEIFTTILDHFKKMIKEQKTSLQISSNFLTQKLNNFSDSSSIKNKLLPVMEKKLYSNKGTTLSMTGGFKTGGSFGGFSSSQTNFRTTSIKKQAEPKISSKTIKDNNFDNYE